MLQRLFICAAALLPLVASAQSKLYPNTFDLSEVELLDSPFKKACDLNVATLLQYDTDRLLAPYLKTASLTPKGESFDNWIGLDGHVGGHYLSALAIHYAATGNKECKDRMDYMVDEMQRAQQANGNGYVGGVDQKCWQDISNGNVQVIWDYWVPWYNEHKTMAGLRDAWVYGGNEKAKDMFVALCDWCVGVVENLNYEQMESMLGNEFGGVDEVLADAYQITGDKKYLDCAKKFSHHWLLDSMEAGVDNLDNKHANTQVPKVVGYQRISELSDGQDADTYDKAARNFWHFVVDDRSLALGGNSRREHFASAADCSSYVEDREGPESCNTNNMLKLTEGLYRMHGDARYADFYERAMYNHILSTQHPDHGGYVYFTSARPGHYRVYSTPNSAMWCCVGTGMENHGKYGQFIYTHQADTLDVNLFVPSRLKWREKDLTLTQTTDFPNTETSTITVNTKKAKDFTLKIRNPWWTQDGKMTVKVNGKEVQHAQQPSSWIYVTRKWKDGDKVELTMPMAINVEPLPNLPQYVAIMRGPILLAADMGNDDLYGLLSDDGRWAHIAHGPLVSIFDAPFMIGSSAEIKNKLNAMRPVEGQSFTYVVDDLFTVPNLDAEGTTRPLTLKPFHDLHDCRYSFYWPTMTKEQYAAYQAEARLREAETMRLDAITVDAVNLAEQQPEVDHALKQKNTSTGNSEGESWRASNSNGEMTFTLDTKRLKYLDLMLRIHSCDARDFEILIDDTVLTRENSASASEGSFANLSFPIAPDMIADKDEVNITLRGATGRLSKLRLLKSQAN